MNESTIVALACNSLVIAFGAGGMIQQLRSIAKRLDKINGVVACHNDRLIVLETRCADQHGSPKGRKA